MRPATTLYIDDDDVLLEALRDALGDEDLTLDYAQTWSEGMDMFQVVGHELVIADYDLQEAKTGLQLLVEVKRSVPSTRLILISGRLTDEARALVEQIPEVDIYIQKGQSDMLEVLLAEAKAAHRRSESTDWPAVGAAHPDASAIDPTRIAQIEESLRVRLKDQP
jgi:DNA-binding response OmpR family regulator